MRSKVVMILAVIAAVGLFMKLATVTPAPISDPKQDMGRQAPDLIFKPNTPGLPAGKLSELKGHVVLVDFWATWCGPCRMSIPELVSIYKKYKDQGLIVIGVSVDDAGTQAQIPAAEKELGINYPVVLASDLQGDVASYSTGSIPSLYMIDKMGKIRVQQDGYDPNGNVEDQVKGLLDGK